MGAFQEAAIVENGGEVSSAILALVGGGQVESNSAAITGNLGEIVFCTSGEM